MGTESTTDQIPTIDFSGLDLSDPGTPAWAAVRAQVRQAIDSVGTFIMGSDKLTPELLDELFGPLAKSMFSLPLDVKQSNTSDLPYGGYIPRSPGVCYESLPIQEPQRLESVQAFAKRMWPQGNPSFCDTVWSLSKIVGEVELMVWRMVLESFGVGKYFDSHAEALMQSFRITEYLTPEDQETRFAMGAHADMNLVTILCQHRNEGLELLTKDGQWLRPPPNTFSVIFGETCEAMSNGRVKPTVHRVRMTSDETRYSALFAVQFRKGYTIQALQELVDEEHQVAFKPYDYVEYLSFRFSEAGWKAKNPLKAYCAVHGDEAAAA